MSVATTDYLTAIAHLPRGAVLSLDHVSWVEYENLLADLGEGYAVRIFYDRGRMEIMAPASTHEKPKSILHTLITALRDELDIDVESLGSTTLKRELKATAAQQDDCFYIQKADLVIGKDDLDLSHDPPPDLVVEIDRTSSSLDKFAMYAVLGVPEIWRLVGQRMEFHLLAEAEYVESATSAAFPLLSTKSYQSS